MSIPEPPQDALAAEPAARRSHFVDFTPLRASPAFARLWIGTSISGIGSQLTVVAIGLQVYDLTESTFAVALVGGFSLVPMIVFGIYAGMLNDAFDRRTILIVTAIDRLVVHGRARGARVDRASTRCGRCTCSR